MYDEPFAADLLRSTRAETKAFGSSLGMNGQNSTRPTAKSAKLAAGNQGVAVPRSSLGARATERLKSPLLFIYVRRCSRHLGQKFYTIAVRKTKPANGQSFVFEFLELEGPR